MTDNGTITFGGDAEDIPPGTYKGRLLGIGVKSSDAFGDFRTWDFQLENGTIIGGASSMNVGKRSKTYKWTVALLGRAPEKGEAVNLLGRECLVVVGLNKDDWPTVDDVLPPMAAAAPAAPVAAPAQAPQPVAVEPDLPF